ncbi:MAG TPA: hypothetical protein VJB59_09910 [Bdellovibrionota bacterium]|nr:hypothetical protein [Bdellovibrionota bacterium]
MKDNFHLLSKTNERVNDVGEICLSDVLTMELKSRRLTSAEICRELGIPKSVFSGWLAGVKPSAKNLPMIRKLACFLDLPIDLLLFNARPDDGAESTVLFSSVFKDEKHRYKLTIEKILDRGSK